MELGQLREYNMKTFFLFKYFAKNEARKLVPDHFLFFKKALHEVKASGQHLSFSIFW